MRVLEIASLSPGPVDWAGRTGSGWTAHLYMTWITWRRMRASAGVTSRSATGCERRGVCCLWNSPRQHHRCHHLLRYGQSVQELGLHHVNSCSQLPILPLTPSFPSISSLHHTPRRSYICIILLVSLLYSHPGSGHVVRERCRLRGDGKLGSGLVKRGRLGGKVGRERVRRSDELTKNRQLTTLLFTHASASTSPREVATARTAGSSAPRCLASSISALASSTCPRRR